MKSNRKTNDWNLCHSWHSISSYRIHQVSVQLESMITEDDMMNVDADLWQIDLDLIRINATARCFKAHVTFHSYMRSVSIIREGFLRRIS